MAEKLGWFGQRPGIYSSDLEGNSVTLAPGVNDSGRAGMRIMSHTPGRKSRQIGFILTPEK